MVNLPRIMGAAEIRERLGGISKSRVHQITVRWDFPRPRWVLAMGKVWLADDVEAWIKINRPELADEPEGGE